MPVFVVTPHDVVVCVFVVLAVLSFAWLKIDAGIRKRRSRPRDRS